jgi:mRNA interferase HigB
MDAKDPTLAWHRHTLKADWAAPTEVKQGFGNASILKDGRVVFNIAGNKYRLLLWINYDHAVVYVRFIGTHNHYDEIDAPTIQQETQAMDIKPIRTKADYRAVLRDIESLMDAEPDSPEGERLDVLTTLVEASEAEHYPMELPDPVYDWEE